jgi:hypothetical protein
MSRALLRVGSMPLFGTAIGGLWGAYWPSFTLPGDSPDQLPRHLWLRLQGTVDALCQGHKVGIKRTDHNAGMRGHGLMQPNEMASIERDHDPLRGHRKRQHVRIGHCLPSPAALGRRQDIVAQAP